MQQPASAGNTAPDGAKSAAFVADFARLTGAPRPFRWQSRLYEEHFAQGRIPSALDLPTGLGKTAVMAIWYLARCAGAALPRRLVYVVDRRAVVDQATAEAEKIKRNAGDESLRISTLRGQYADNREWLEDPVANAIIVGTVDMIGSRLLFEGYGVSRRMRPYQAGLLGADSLIVLDESHLVPPFQKLLEQIAAKSVTAELGARDEADRALIPRFRVLPLSATGDHAGEDVFRLTEEDRAQDEAVAQRLQASKHLRFITPGGKKLEEDLAKLAWELADGGDSPARILVYCNSREVAGKTKVAIEKLAKGDKKQGIPAVDIEPPELIVGARRVKERERAKEKLQALGYFSGTTPAPPKPAFVIATAAGEVGIDLDADHLVMDLVPFERLVQRLGRVNRLGGEGREAQILVIDAPSEGLPDELEVRAEQAARVLRDNGIDSASPAVLERLKHENEAAVRAATTPPPLYPALTRPLVEAWSMTSLREHTGRPEVQPWLRGWVKEDPQTTVVWRAHLPVRKTGEAATRAEQEAFFEAAPPHLAEKLETTCWAVRDWLGKRFKRLDKTADRARTATAEQQAGPALPEAKEVVAFALGRANERAAAFTFDALREKVADKRAFEREMPGVTLVLDARLGGLSDDGLLEVDAGLDSVSAADAEDGWLLPGLDKPAVPFRVRREVCNAATEMGDPAPEASGTIGPWRTVYAFDAERDAEGNPAVQLVVEAWHEDKPGEDARAFASRPQALAEHQDWVAERSKMITAALGLPEALAELIPVAGRLHDEGKRAGCWQDAFHTRSTGRPYAKTGSRRPPAYRILNGYRHEFGSLGYVENDAAFQMLPLESQELLLHLVAAHHGRARPVIETDNCEGAPPSVLESRAREVALRFAKLQERYGPWGLAWLEALLRAADQQASRALDKETGHDG